MWQKARRLMLGNWCLLFNRLGIAISRLFDLGEWFLWRRRWCFAVTWNIARVLTLRNRRLLLHRLILAVRYIFRL